MYRNSTILKVCGMREADNIRSVDALDIDWMGFIFYPLSKRFVAAMPSYLPRKGKRVGVFVNESMDVILEKVRSYFLDIVQLHGDESPEFCTELLQQPIRVMKAFSIANHLHSEEIAAYEGCCDYFLFDTQTLTYGGSGRQFNWDILQDYTGNTPFILSGGIGLDNVQAILELNNPMCIGIDINSKFELSPANKDVQSIKQFIELWNQ